MHEPRKLLPTDHSSATRGHSKADYGEHSIHQAWLGHPTRLHRECLDVFVSLTMRTIEMQTTKMKRGFSLLELMISMALGLIVLGSIVQLFKSGMDSTRLVVQRAELQQNMR